MTEFIASNGVGVESWMGEGLVLSSGAVLMDKSVRALREFFQDERDKELRRWRFPEKKCMVVYPRSQTLLVVDERFGDSIAVAREGRDTTGRAPNRFHAAAAAYLDAHPVRKPWEDAENGEIWVLTVDGFPSPWQHARVSFIGLFSETRGDQVFPASDRITAGRRIWPEVAS